jgi:hypothetical protein
MHFQALYESSGVQDFAIDAYEPVTITEKEKSFAKKLYENSPSVKK